MLFFAFVALVIAAVPSSKHTCADLSHEDDEMYHASFGNIDFDATITNKTLVGRSAKEIMDCAQDWVKRQVPYCQCNGPAECCGSCPYCSTTRCDCSGYVSHCWGLSHGYTTQTMHEISHPIAKDDLAPGDIMLFASEHVIIFGGWTDGGKTHYHAFQEPGCHTSGPHHAFRSVVPYPNSWSPSSFKPYRYDHKTA